MSVDVKPEDCDAVLRARIEKFMAIQKMTWDEAVESLVRKVVSPPPM